MLSECLRSLNRNTPLAADMVTLSSPSSVLKDGPTEVQKGGPKRARFFFSGAVNTRSGTYWDKLISIMPARTLWRVLGQPPVKQTQVKHLPNSTTRTAPCQFCDRFLLHITHIWGTPAMSIVNTPRSDASANMCRRSINSHQTYTIVEFLCGL